MLIKPKVLDALAETLEGLALSGEAKRSRSKPQEASLLIYHPQARSGKTSGTPLVEINFFEDIEGCTMIVNSALGMVEMHEVEEIRLVDSTREAAFFGRMRGGKLSMVT